jgi:tetratricopeptide (TPR) repeat protein
MSPESDRAEEPPHAGPEFPEAGFKIGEYVIESMLGHGSMSTVFEASDSTGHRVALKVFQESRRVSDSMMERFRREIEASKQLREHPNIITVYSTGQDSKTHYIAMEKITDSRTLEAVMETDTLSIDTIIEFGIKLARALAFAHDRNILHRDVKPTNIMLNSFGDPVLCDFGVAALLEWPRFTVPGALTGTPMYMSPEQSRGENLTVSSDLYSLAVVIYQALTGAMPYNSQRLLNIPDTLRAVQHEPARRPRQFRGEISLDLEAVLLKALDKRPDRRYQDGNSFADDLEKARSGKRVEARHYSTLLMIEHTVHRYRRLLVIVCAVAMVILGTMAYLLSVLRQEQYRGLMGEARLENSQEVLQRLRGPQKSPPAAAPARQSLLRAREAMAEENWQAAQAHLENSLRISGETYDVRTGNLARLESARCAYMLQRHEDAEKLYSEVIQSEDASASTRGAARLELAGMIVRGLSHASMEKVRTSGLPAGPNPYLDATNCVAGELHHTDLAARIYRLPARVRGANYFAAAVAALWEQDRVSALVYLHHAISTARPVGAWPAQLAQSLMDSLLTQPGENTSDS